MTSIAAMFLMHGAYKQVNGLLTDREPAYLYATGLHLLAFWAPILVPADASDERLAQIIAEGDEFNIKDLTAPKLPAFREGLSGRSMAGRGTGLDAGQSDRKRDSLARVAA